MEILTKSPNHTQNHWFCIDFHDFPGFQWTIWKHFQKIIFFVDFFSPRWIHRLGPALWHSTHETISYVVAFRFFRFSISKTNFCWFFENLTQYFHDPNSLPSCHILKPVHLNTKNQKIWLWKWKIGKIEMLRHRKWSHEYCAREPVPTDEYIEEKKNRQKTEFLLIFD